MQTSLSQATTVQCTVYLNIDNRNKDVTSVIKKPELLILLLTQKTHMATIFMLSGISQQTVYSAAHICLSTLC